MSGDKEKKICVVGVSHKEDKFGYRIFADLIKAGFTVEGVNPADGEICGKKLYRTLGELPEKPDLVITVVPHQVTERIVDQAHSLGIREIWMQPGSESELAINKAEGYGISVIHHACFMREKGIW
jgi:predicted CoA-binding protein